jgi:hypothetical protein
MNNHTATLFLLCCLVVLNACGTAPSVPPIATIAPVPSPTIAAIANPTAEPALAPAPAPVAQPTATPRPAPLPTSNPAIFSYLWPAYLPEGMQPAPKESRVAGDAELGTNAPGFYLVTFNADDGKRKIILGGGAVEPFALSGETKEVELFGRKATLISNGDQRLVRFATIAGQGSLFLFGVGVAEPELLQSAESLLPIELADMRARVGQ